jgi:hypothetical protein
MVSSQLTELALVEPDSDRDLNLGPLVVVVVLVVEKNQLELSGQIPDCDLGLGSESEFEL